MVDTPLPDDLVELGRVLSAFGVRGWVKVQPYSEQAQVLLKARVWWLQAPGQPASPGNHSSGFIPFEVVSSRRHSDTLIAQFQELTNREAAQALRGYPVFIPRSQFPEPDADEFYWVDLVGCQIYGEQDDGSPAYLGTVEGVIDNGVHAVLRVHRATQEADGVATPLTDAKGRPIETLVPFVQAHVHGVDLAARRLDSNWPVDF